MTRDLFHIYLHASPFKMVFVVCSVSYNLLISFQQYYMIQLIYNKHYVLKEQSFNMALMF